jgi:hypothetical protein
VSYTYKCLGENRLRSNVRLHPMKEHHVGVRRTRLHQEMLRSHRTKYDGLIAIVVIHLNHRFLIYHGVNGVRIAPLGDVNYVVMPGVRCVSNVHLHPTKNPSIGAIRIPTNLETALYQVAKNDGLIANVVIHLNQHYIIYTMEIGVRIVLVIIIKYATNPIVCRVTRGRLHSAKNPSIGAIRTPTNLETVLYQSV